MAPFFMSRIQGQEYCVDTVTSVINDDEKHLMEVLDGF